MLEQYYEPGDVNSIYKASIEMPVNVDLTQSQLYQVVALSLCYTPCYEADNYYKYEGISAERFIELADCLVDSEWDYIKVLQKWRDDPDWLEFMHEFGRQIVCEKSYSPASVYGKYEDGKTKNLTLNAFTGGEMMKPHVFELASHFKVYANPSELSVNDQFYLEQKFEEAGHDVNEMIKSLVETELTDEAKAQPILKSISPFYK